MSGNYAESHTRKQKPGVFNGKAFYDKRYKVVENLLQEVMCDITNGLAKSDIKKKLTDGLYESTEKKYKEKTANDLYYAAIAKIKEDYKQETDDARAVLQSRYDNLYRETLELGDFNNAIKALQELGKLFGLNTPAQNTVKINKDEISISFGFNEDEG